MRLRSPLLLALLLGAALPVRAAEPVAAQLAKDGGQIVPLPSATSAAVRVSATADRGIVIGYGDLPAPRLSSHGRMTELRFKGRPQIDLAALRALPGMQSVGSRVSRGELVISLRGVAGAFQPAAADTPGTLVLSPGTGTGATKTARPVKGDPSVAELNSLRDSIAGKLAALNAMPIPSLPSSGVPGPEAGPGLDGNSFATMSDTRPPSPTGPPRPACPALPFASWIGRGGYANADVALRSQVAHAPDDLRAVAALAQFYVVHGLPNEALGLLSGWSDDDPAAPGREAVMQVRDIARLLRNEPIESASPLLASPADCEHPELPIWLALNAAASGAVGDVAANGRRARAVLSDIPEPLRTRFALAIADASDDDPETGKAMIAATRDSHGGTAEDIAGRWMMQARFARANRQGDDEKMFLGRAVAYPDTVPGRYATLRLDAMQLRRPGDEAVRARKQLQDFARTYRYDNLGQEAALTLARLQLAESDYAGALDLADAAAQAGRRGSESSAARFAAGVLRRLLVDPPAGKPLPDAGERIALFWRYEGYATPGEHGDDIRVAASKLLLHAGFADSALDVARQLSPATLGQRSGLLLRATAEAQAEIGDPNAAMAMLQRQGQSEETATIAAAALLRLGKPIEAAKAASTINTAAGRTERAELLYDAGAWADAAAAYGDLLRDAGVVKDRRAEATRRYALAVSLASGPPRDAPAADLLTPDPVSDQLLAVAVPTPAAPPGSPPVATVRSAIERAHKIETLLNP